MARRSSPEDQAAEMSAQAFAAPGRLTFADLEAMLAVGEPVKWHPLYQREAWKDGEPPLCLTDVARLGSLFFVGYICADRSCRCRTRNPPGHHLLVKEDGMALFGRGVEVVTGKNKTEVVLVDQPAFIVVIS